jgi:hypothetical protein
VNEFPARRFVRGGTGAAASHQFVDVDGLPADPGGTVTVVVARADGTTVPTAAIAGTGTAPRTAAIAAADIATVDRLLCVWSVNGVAFADDEIEVVGHPLITPDDVKALDKAMSGRTTPDIWAAIRAVQDTAATVLQWSPVERLAVDTLDGSGWETLTLDWFRMRQVRFATVTGATIDTTDLAAIPPSPPGIAVLPSGRVWPAGTSNVRIGYMHGTRSIPSDLLRALTLSVRHVLAAFTTGIPSMAVSMQSVDGFNVQLASPDSDKWATGDRDVDRVINRHRMRRIPVA